MILCAIDVLLEVPTVVGHRHCCLVIEPENAPLLYLPEVLSTMLSVSMIVHAAKQTRSPSPSTLTLLLSLPLNQLLDFRLSTSTNWSR